MPNEIAEEVRLQLGRLKTVVRHRHREDKENHPQRESHEWYYMERTRIKRLGRA